jgi:hypothetical protein
MQRVHIGYGPVEVCVSGHVRALMSNGINGNGNEMRPLSLWLRLCNFTKSCMDVPLDPAQRCANVFAGISSEYKSGGQETVRPGDQTPKTWINTLLKPIMRHYSAC